MFLTEFEYINTQFFFSDSTIIRVIWICINFIDDVLQAKILCSKLGILRLSRNKYPRNFYFTTLKKLDLLTTKLIFNYAKIWKKLGELILYQSWQFSKIRKFLTFTAVCTNQSWQFSKIRKFLTFTAVCTNRYLELLQHKYSFSCERFYFSVIFLF